jgi:hypothetical protein
MVIYWEQALYEKNAKVLQLALRQIGGVAVIAVPFQLHHLTQKGEASPGAD